MLRLVIAKLLLFIESLGENNILLNQLMSTIKGFTYKKAFFFCDNSNTIVHFVLIPG